MINEAGLALVKASEGCRLQAYLDAGGLPTIGYGHVAGVKLGQTCTQEQAAEWLREDLEKAVAAVSAAVKVPLNENEAAACASLTFNVGAANFRKSSVCRLLNAGDRSGAARAFLLWDKATVAGKLTVLPGLARRRASEMALFLTPAEHDGIPEESGVTAVEPPKPVTSSLTIKGAAGSLVGGVVWVAGVVPDILPDVTGVREQIAALGFDVKWLSIACAALVVIGSAAAIWGRIRNRRAGMA